jgi:hypothetical protein
MTTGFFPEFLGRLAMVDEHPPQWGSGRRIDLVDGDEQPLLGELLPDICDERGRQSCVVSP